MGVVTYLGLLLVCLSVASVQAYNAYGYDKRIPPEDLERTPLKEAAQGDCNLDVLKYCQKDFATDLGTDPSVFQQPALLKTLLAKIYKKPVNQGFTDLCGARNRFSNCLSGSYAICTDIYNMLGTQGYNRDDAFILAGIYNNIDFDCNSGFTQATDNFDCIAYVHNSQTYQTTSKACYDAYDDAVTKDHTKFCPASETYSLCLANIYTDKTIDQCDFRELKWWECERALRRSKLDGFCNTITCQQLFDSATPNEFSSFMDQVDKGGFIPKAKLDLYKLYPKLAARHAQRNAQSSA